MYEGQTILKNRMLWMVGISQWVFAFIIASIYIGKLTAFFAVPRLKYPETLQEVVSSDTYTPYIVRGSALQQYLQVELWCGL